MRIPQNAKSLAISCVAALTMSLGTAFADESTTLRIFTWDGYVTAEDIAAVNQLLSDAGNPCKAAVIDTLAQGPEQMFDVIRAEQCDISFLTLNYIKMQDERIARLLQPINVNSPRIPEYANTLPSLRQIPMGLSGGKPLYVPYGGGAYGIWANMKKVSKDELPAKASDLLSPKWKGELSLTKGQIQPNVALALMILGKPAFHVNDLVESGDRAEAMDLCAADGELQATLSQLYGQVGSFWEAAPTFEHKLVASYGIEIAGLRAKGEDWQLVNFAEGNTVWLDTMNIMASVSGAKLEAAEIFINYFLSKPVQERVVNSLSMVGAIQGISNPMIDANPDFFKPTMFWPPYTSLADNLMRTLSDNAMKK